jgi:hypothetical protein
MEDPNATWDIKKCTKCEKTKPYSQFHKREGGRLRSHCKECMNNQSREYQMRPDQREKRAEIWRKSSRYLKYGLTEDTFIEMFDAQDAQCAICKISIDHGCCVDHCHDTGKVRGLLCRQCNSGIGMLKDDPALLREAIWYLT